MKIGFDNQRYLSAQTKAIKERLARFKGKLYLEIGGKLYGDFHAARTLPGYHPDTKLFLLEKLKKDLEVIFCISAKQLSSGKERGDWGISYDLATVVALENLKNFGFPVSCVVINRYDEEKEADIFQKKLQRKGYRVYRRYEIEGYPHDLFSVLSKNGYGKDDYIKTERPVVVVWGAGPGSGKFSTCLGQVYHDKKKTLNSGYAKLETFPIWDLPLEHPVNLAYEAATADLGDYNLIDPYHLAAYKKVAINYNRDVESFPVLQTLIPAYHSPTDMGVNMMNRGIIDNTAVSQAAKREIIFYLFRYRREYFKGLVEKNTLDKIESLLRKLGISEDKMPTVPAARLAKKRATKDSQKGERGNFCGAAIELSNGKVITGKNSPLLHAEAACILNALKILARIPDSIDLLSSEVIKSFKEVKSKSFKEESESLELNEVLVSLAISSATNPTVKKALERLPELRNCYLHTTHIPSQGDETIFRKLGIWLSTDGEIATKP